MLSQRAGPLMREWLEALREDETANTVDLPDRGKKRKAGVSFLFFHPQPCFCFG